MKTVTLTPSQALALTLPGDTPELLRECSPISRLFDSDDLTSVIPGVVIVPDCGDDSCVAHYYSVLVGRGRYYSSSVNLLLSSHTGRFHAAKWLTAKGHPAWHLLDGPAKIEPWISAVCLWASVLRVQAGLTPIVDVVERKFSEPWIARHLSLGSALVTGADGARTITLEIP